jgi:Twin arginine targeting (Tat) protein translocase TatC
MAEKQIITKETEANETSFWDHLEELRWTLLRPLIAFVILFCFTMWALPNIFDKFVLGATSSDFFIYRFFERISGGLIAFDNDFSVKIININVASQFTTHIATAMGFAAVLVFPYFVYQLWRFIRPALYQREMKNVRAAFVGGTFMFYVGCFVGYALVFPFTFRFLVEYELSGEIVNQISLQSYIYNFTMLILVMGIVFEMPLLAWLLSSIGLIKRQMLQKYRRHAIVVLMFVSALITPSGDPFTLMIVFLPLYLLYELSVCVVKKA